MVNLYETVVNSVRGEYFRNDEGHIILIKDLCIKEKSSSWQCENFFTGAPIYLSLDLSKTYMHVPKSEIENMFKEIVKIVNNLVELKQQE